MKSLNKNDWLGLPVNVVFVIDGIPPGTMAKYDNVVLAIPKLPMPPANIECTLVK